MNIKQIMKFLNFICKCFCIFLCVACSESETTPEVNYSVTVDKEFIKFAYKNEEASFVPVDFEGINNESKLFIFDQDLSIEDLSLNTEFEILTDDPVLISTGTDLGFSKIYNGYIETYKSSKDFKSKVLNERIKLPSALKKNVKYQMGFRKDFKGVTFYLIGGSISIKRIYANNDDLYQSSMRGKPFFQIFNGSFRISKSVLSSDYDKETKVSIYGDSFIEGFALFMNNLSLDNRWSSKLSKDIGLKKCLIDGKGGDRICPSFFERFNVENSWFKSKYVILSLGTNNGNPGEYFDNIQKIIKVLKTNNQIPILVTVTPRPEYDFYKTGYVINQWIKSSGELYVDMNKVVTNANDSGVWKTDYVLPDGIHPTVKAYNDMYNELKNDCPFLF